MGMDDRVIFQGNPKRCVLGAAVAIAVLMVVDIARGDLIRTKKGQTIECEVVEDLGKALRLRTRLGVVDLPKDEIDKRKTRKSPWEEYRERRKKCDKTADAHYALAMWCDERDLGPERSDELDHALELDPNHAATRAALGFEKEDSGAWVRKASGNAPNPDDIAADRQAAKEERLVRKIISEWFVKIRAIHDARMSPKRGPVNRKKFKDARENILKIRDPLAIPALTGVLSAGNKASRLVLIESLAQFPDDDATMNLIVMSILDPSKQVRRAAAQELARRDDPRVIDRLQDALYSEEEGILRHSATALGVLRAVEVTPNLIEQLSTEVPGIVRHSRAVYLGDIYGTFGGRARIVHGGYLVGYSPGSIGVLGPGSWVGTETYYERTMVSVYRTEVQEALIAISGENFGFDRHKWIDWWESNKPRR
ncbi:MAG TPA: HEAT repeat domain-containing protein [Phycisphaerae bacterium]|nr:HEAT repeat domain-containing protein [Phycisphaerae bacterium]HRW53045.1 HEAT repeat domain-containing protein [Phycisphaerae bacterium]